MTSQPEKKLKLTNAVKLLGYYVIYVWNKTNEAKLEREILLGNLKYNEILINETSKPIEKLKKNYFREKLIKSNENSNNFRNSNLIHLILLKFNGLKRYMLFQEINENDIREISRYIKHEFYKKGSYIFRQNETSTALYGIISGKTEVRLVKSKDLTKTFYMDMIKGENLEEFQQNNDRDNVPFEYFMSDCEVEDETKVDKKKESSDEDEEDKKKYIKIIKSKRNQFLNEKKDDINLDKKIYKEGEILHTHRGSIMIAENELKRRELEEKKRLERLQNLKEEQIDDMIENQIYNKKKILIQKNINKIIKISKLFKEKKKSKTIKIIKAIKKHQTPDNLDNEEILSKFISEFEIKRLNITEGMCFGEWGLVYNIPRTTSIYCVEDTHVFLLEKRYFDKHLIKKFYAGDMKKIKFIYDRLPALRKSFESKGGHLISHILTKIVPNFYDEGDIVYTPYDKAKTVYLIYKGECLLTRLNFKTKDKLDYLNKKEKLTLVASVGEGGVCGLESIEDNKMYEHCLMIKQNFTILLKLEFDIYNEEMEPFKEALRPLYELHSKILNKLKYKHDLIKKELNLNAQIRKIKHKKFLEELNSKKEVKNSTNDKKLGELSISIDKNNTMLSGIKRNNLPNIESSNKIKKFKRKNLKNKFISKRFSILTENFENILEKKNNITNIKNNENNKSKFFLTDTTFNQNLETEQNTANINRTLPTFSNIIKESIDLNPIKGNKIILNLKSELYSDINKEKKSKIQILKEEIGADSFILDSVYNFKKKKTHTQFNSGMFDIPFLSQINL